MFPQARSFSSGDDTQASTSTPDFVDNAAEAGSDFGPSAILNAVAGVEEDAWLAAREDVWFFNRYMQTVLRFAQETTGLPWYTLASLQTLQCCTLPRFDATVADDIGGKLLQSQLYCSEP